jgi:hypothetical protein
MKKEQVMAPPPGLEAGADRPRRPRILQVGLGAIWYLANLGGVAAALLTHTLG